MNGTFSLCDTRSVSVVCILHVFSFNLPYASTDFLLFIAMERHFASRIILVESMSSLFMQMTLSTVRRMVFAVLTQLKVYIFLTEECNILKDPSYGKQPAKARHHIEAYSCMEALIGRLQLCSPFIILI